MNDYPKTITSYLIYFFKPYKYLLLGIVILLFAFMLLNRLPSYYFSKIIDVITENMQHRDIWAKITPLLLMILVAEILFNLLRRLAFYLAQFVSPKLKIAVKEKTLEHILNYSPNFLLSNHAGNLAERLFKLSGETINIFWLTFFDIGIPIVSLLVVFGLLCWVNFVFGAIFFFWIGTFLFLVYYTSKKTQKFAYDAAEKTSISSGHIVDIITNFLIVKSFSNFSFERRRLKPKLYAERKAAYLNLSKVQNSRILQVFVMTLSYLNIIIYAVYLWQNDVISAGDIVFIVLLVNLAMQGLSVLILNVLNLNESIGIIRNSLDFFAEPYEIVDFPYVRRLRVNQGKIEFRDIDFSYNNRSKIFKDFNLIIKPKEKVGIIGASGAGKTTLVSLLQRFYNLNHGAILIDEQDISKVSQESLNKSISIIPQEPLLFNRSLLDNIKYGKPHATIDEVIKASKKAFAHDFICAKKDKYDTVVGERGVKLSGGQRQRIAIARAILTDAPIIVFDEATSALDIESEKIIQKGIAQLMKNRTVIAIAHRLSTLKEMDRIVVLNEGRIVEEGTPSELLDKDGEFAKLWHLQTDA